MEQDYGPPLRESGGGGLQCTPVHPHTASTHPDYTPPATGATPRCVICNGNRVTSKLNPLSPCLAPATAKKMRAATRLWLGECTTCNARGWVSPRQAKVVHALLGDTVDGDMDQVVNCTHHKACKKMYLKGPTSCECKDPTPPTSPDALSSPAKRRSTPRGNGGCRSPKRGRKSGASPRTCAMCQSSNKKSKKRPTKLVQESAIQTLIASVESARSSPECDKADLTIVERLTVASLGFAPGGTVGSVAGDEVHVHKACRDNFNYRISKLSRGGVAGGGGEINHLMAPLTMLILQELNCNDVITLVDVGELHKEAHGKSYQSDRLSESLTKHWETSGDELEIVAGRRGRLLVWKKLTAGAAAELLLAKKTSGGDGDGDVDTFAWPGVERPPERGCLTDGGVLSSAATILKLKMETAAAKQSTASGLFIEPWAVTQEKVCSVVPRDVLAFFLDLVGIDGWNPAAFDKPTEITDRRRAGIAKQPATECPPDVDCAAWHYALTLGQLAMYQAVGCETPLTTAIGVSCFEFTIHLDATLLLISLFVGRMYKNTGCSEIPLQYN